MTILLYSLLQAYDKTARLLGLDLSKGGGPALEALAREGDPLRFKFSIPMRASKTGSKTCDFSYAGMLFALIGFLNLYELVIILTIALICCS